MNCFYHQDTEAVGVCKSCQKGLCSSCAVDLEQGLACLGKCEADVRVLIDFIARNMELGNLSRNMVRSHPRNILFSAVFLLVVGSLFVGWGLGSGGPSGFLVTLGGGFMLYGLVRFARAWKLRKFKHSP